MKNEPKLPTQKYSRAEKGSYRVINASPKEAAIIALRQAFLKEFPDRRCWVLEGDYEFRSLSESEASGTCLMRSVVDGKDREAPPVSIEFSVAWEAGKDASTGLPEVALVRHNLTRADG